MANEINVIELYNAVNILAKINHAGYESADSFNSKLKTTETAFLEAFHIWDEDDQSNTDHLAPFRKEEELVATNGFVTLPEDYAHKSAVQGVYLENDCEGGNPERTLYPVIHYRTNEIAEVLVDAISKPVISNPDTFGLTFVNEGIQLYPSQLKSVKMTYLRYPVYGKIEFIYTTSPETGDVFIPDPLTSRNLQWKQVTFEYFKYALLYLLGIELKELMLMNAGVMGKIINVIKYK